MNYYVYILASATDYTVYIGVTNNLLQRVYEHKNHLDPDSFTSRYNVHKLVYFEQTSDVRAALEREKTTKGMAAFQEKRIDSNHESGVERLVSGTFGIESRFFDFAALRSE